MADKQKPVEGLSYTEDSIDVLEGREAVRRRPGMYVGGTDLVALHHLVYEVVDNSIDEALAGVCDHIEVYLHADGSCSVLDNGRGIPTGIHPKQGKSTLEVVMTVLHAGGKFGDGGYKVSGGLHGVGVSAVNALSSHLEVEVQRDGYFWQQEYAEGIPQYEVKKGKKTKATGTRVTFVPDGTIFPETTFSFKTLATRFREMAFVTRGIRIRLVDERVEPIPDEVSFYFEGGITSFVRYKNRSRKPLHEVVFMEREADGIGVEVAIQYADHYFENVQAFANTINTPDGGTHLEGLRAALTRSINYHAKKAGTLKDKDPNFTGDDTRKGLTAVVSIKHPDPQFESQTKVKLMNADVKSLVQSVVNEEFSDFLQRDSKAARDIVSKCLDASRERIAVQRTRDLVRRDSLLASTTLPGKLADCSERNAERSELYIVEGDSAGGSAKQGRDRQFQAILPLRGKILNTERARLDKVLDNKEIQALISALGVGISDEFDLENLRYGRVIIMTDADVDGLHIRTLLLTFFYRYMTPLIENGHLYIAQPPLYLVKHKKGDQYAYTEEEKEKLVKGFGADKVGLQRYKGLGEMNPEQLWDTTMDPANRNLLQVNIDDASTADHTFTMLMGSEVPPRRKFIQTHAKEVRNLDI